MSDFKSDKEASVRVIASNKNWMESEAVNQLKNTAKLQGICMAVGLPDLHPGNKHPIGAAFISKGYIYPELIGNDIGCGMGLWKTELKTQKLKIDKLSSKLQNLDSPFDGDITTLIEGHGLEPTSFNHLLGTIGGGNHFAELQAVEAIIDQEMASTLKLDKNQLYLLVHSGSRGLGESILQNYIAAHGYKGLQDDTPEAQFYINAHDHAVKWAEANRSLIVQRFLSCLGVSGEKLLDVNHNTVLPHTMEGTKCWLHRKGATPSTEGAVMIPGSRGSYSYLVLPIGAQDQNAYSLAHGAGRKWKRNDAKGRLKKYKVGDFLKTTLGSTVICENKDLIYEEAPQSYKNIDVVVNDLVDAGLIRIIAVMRPVITYKTRRHK